MQDRPELTQDSKPEATKEMTKFSLGTKVKPGDIRLNNVLMNIPPESITIIQTEYDDSSFMLREPIPSTRKRGKKKILVHMPLAFDLGESGSNYSDIAKLLIQIRKSPIVTVENEKLRSEIYGPNSDESISMAFLVESISGSIDGEYPSLLRCDIQMAWFNHLPYTPSVLYRGAADGSEPLISKNPTSLFNEYYTTGTTTQKGLINDPLSSEGLLLEDTLEIFYKEYNTFNESVDISFDPKMPSQMTKRVKTRIKSQDERLREEGWMPAAERMGYPDVDGVYYRWRKFDIPTTALDQNGALILESLSFAINTNISYIPLQGYSVPTAQFMGGSIAEVDGIVYAAAEKDSENNPIATSLKLAQLQKIFDRTAENRILYEKYGGEDYVMFRHPITKLLKYKPYTENRYEAVIDEPNASINMYPERLSQVNYGVKVIKDNHYYNPELTEIKKVTFDYNDLLPLVISNRVSATIQGQPFASRFQFKSKETRLKNDNDTIKIAGENISDGNGAGLGRNSLKSSWIDIVKELESKYQIKKIEGQQKAFFQITSEIREPDREEALMVAQGLSNLLSVDNEISGVSSAVASRWFLLTTTELRNRRLRQTIWEKDSRRDINFLNSENMNVIVINLLKKAAKAEYRGWAKAYTEKANAVTQLAQIPESETYPDLLLPKGKPSPSYYFYDFEDENFHRSNAMKGMDALSQNIHNNIMENFISKDAVKNVGEDYVPPVGGYTTAFNLSSSNENAAKSGMAHDPSNEDHRKLLALQAMGAATAMTNSLRQAFPTFKIYLKQDSLFFESELSLADRSAREQRSALSNFRDFSEYFDVSNVIDIRIVKDENEPADLLVIRIVGTDRDKVNKIKRDIESQTMSHLQTHREIIQRINDRKEEGTKITDAEMHMKKYGLTEGVRIQARLGYEVDPNKLNVEFNGKIVSVSGKDIIEVVCLGNGEELIKEIKAPTIKDKYSFNSNTPDLIAKLTENSPEIVSFGNLNYKSDLGFEISFMPEFAGGRSALDNVFAPSLFKGYTMPAKAVNTVANTAKYYVLISSAMKRGVWGATKLAITGVAAASAGKVLLVAAAAAAAYEGFKIGDRWLNGSPFTVYNNTVWDVLQELTYRHPGTICSVVPYDNRSTIYFGEPSEQYFYRGPTPLEAGITVGDTFFRQTLREQLDYDVYNLDKEMLEASSAIVGTERQQTINKKKVTRSEIQSNAKATKDEIILSMVRPFRTYHLVASEHDIISNTIETTSRNVGNAVQIAYPSKSKHENFDGSVGFTDYELTEMKADDDIDASQITKKVFTFHNAHKDSVDDLPERYAKSKLVKELERVYRGKLTIMGRANIKPHDILILRDTVNDIMGPVGVSKVIHLMSPHGGWITEIVPKLIVFPDNASGAYQLSTVAKGAAYWLSDEFQRFYTNLKRYMPSENGFSNLGTNIADLVRLANGSDVVDYENLDLYQKTDLDISNPSTWMEDRNIQAGSAAIGAAGLAAGTNSLMFAAGVPERLAGSTVNTARQLGTTATSIFGSGSVTNIATNTTRTVLTGASVVTKSALTLGSVFAGPLVHLGFSTFIDGIVSWTKYRQPIMFFPLYREGEAWYAALDGFKDNTIIQHFGLEAKRVKNKFEFYNIYNRVLNDSFRK
ncbi:MAG: hypothetical protein PHY47_00345 [Lachnospiraceae bacterium]|nr:hypothetical protein [Lachnospiraceae bacterium]